MGGGPEGAVLLEPFCDGRAEAHVVTKFFAAQVFVAEDFVHLVQEEAPEFRQRRIVRGVETHGRVGVLVESLNDGVVFLEGRDGHEEEIVNLGRQVQGGGRLGVFRAWDHQGASFREFLVRHHAQVTAAGHPEGLGPRVYLGEQISRERDADGGLVWRAVVQQGNDTEKSEGVNVICVDSINTP